MDGVVEHTGRYRTGHRPGGTQSLVGAKGACPSPRNRLFREKCAPMKSSLHFAFFAYLRTPTLCCLQPCRAFAQLLTCRGQSVDTICPRRLASQILARRRLTFSHGLSCTHGLYYARHGVGKGGNAIEDGRPGWVQEATKHKATKHKRRRALVFAHDRRDERHQA